VAAAFGLTLGFTGQAAAASQHLWTYTAGNLCVSGYSEISAGAGGGGFSKSITYGYNRSGSGTCSLANKPVGWLSVESHLLAFDMPRGVWYLCNRVGPFRNPVSGYMLEVGRNTYRACGGDVWYATHTGAYGWDGGAWRGNWVVSGNHWVPRAALAATETPAPPKTSAAEAVRRGEVRLGSPAGPKLTAARLQAAPGGTALNVPSAPEGEATVKTLTR
jgi:hypothetical protein